MGLPKPRRGSIRKNKQGVTWLRVERKKKIFKIKKSEAFLRPVEYFAIERGWGILT